MVTSILPARLDNAYCCPLTFHGDRERRRVCPVFAAVGRRAPALFLFALTRGLLFDENYPLCIDALQ